MERRNKHLSSEARGAIFAERNRGCSQGAIGRLLGRPASTICRELARGRQTDGSFCPTAARRVYDKRRRRCRCVRRLVEGEVFVLACLHASRKPMHWKERLKG